MHFKQENWVSGKLSSQEISSTTWKKPSPSCMTTGYGWGGGLCSSVPQLCALCWSPPRTQKRGHGACPGEQKNGDSFFFPE